MSDRICQAAFDICHVRREAVREGCKSSRPTMPLRHLLHAVHVFMVTDWRDVVLIIDLFFFFGLFLFCVELDL